ncbi:hypothetical protein VII00023_17649 [Vibrio ichthyoenteri ATCC 700023]|uniref:Uncharacterized protein n=1 Tax=Vibrio ichthyoenteri ATCC 700023 TaxID=870968 RepID=F9RYB1_9VIBR|nr:hypothetical protein VII00023_17649 [Vibrio ichthyoenteri ATCC 700023]
MLVDQKSRNSCNARLFGSGAECQEDCSSKAIELQENQLPKLNAHCNGYGEYLSSCYIGTISLIKNH